MNLIPSKPQTTVPNYWCTWATQALTMTPETPAETAFPGDQGLFGTRDNLNSRVLFGKQGWARDWDGIREFEYLSREQYVTEEIMLGLRTDRGVPRRLLMSESSRERNTEKLLRAGALVPVGGVFSDKGGSGQEPRLRIPEDRFFVSDDIIAGLP